MALRALMTNAVDNILIIANRQDHTGCLNIFTKIELHSISVYLPVKHQQCVIIHACEHTTTYTVYTHLYVRAIFIGYMCWDIKK